MRLQIEENKLYLDFELTKGKPVVFLHFGSTPYHGEIPKRSDLYTMLEIQATGSSSLEHWGVTPMATLPGSNMNYLSHTDTRNEKGRLIEITTKDENTGLVSVMSYQFFDGISVMRCTHTVKNEGENEIGLEYLSTYVQGGIADEWEEELSLLIPHNSWQEEIQWKETPINQLGYHTFSDCGTSSKRVQIRNIGSWSAGEYLPMACLRNATKNTMLFWQIEHNGAWNYEIQERDRKLALVINGPDEINHHWWKSLKPGESFTSVPASVGSVVGGVDETFGELTKYRRAIRRKNKDNEKLPIIFNDYMNCLFGDPTTEKELPIIDAAAEIGCEYYCIDAGWYTDENWWYKVGEWQPSKTRFPGGLKEVTDYIRGKGMIPGIWIEIETMGIQCKLADEVDKSWYFIRHGKPMLDRDRYQLDFRNPKVRKYTRGVIDRLIKDYGIGYFKIDYNINAGIGTDYQSDSAGDGLLEHNRAYLSWLDEIFKDYPDVVIENCSSGGMRMDYAMLSRYSIQSTSDQTNYLHYASIAANAPSALTPEQAAIWSYPLSDSTKEQTIFNCINSCLLRIHQSGHMGVLAQDKKEIVKQELELYKTLRKSIPSALPFWPLGLAKDGDDWMSLGLDCNEKSYLAIWHLLGDCNCELPLPKYKGKDLTVKVAFPSDDKKCKFEWNKEDGILKVNLPEEKMARLLEIF